jgi:hypothetical protein
MLSAIVFLFGLLTPSKAEIPQGVRVQNIQAMGRGCPSGSFSATVSPDGQTFSILLDQYVAESTRQMTLDRKECQLRVDFAVPTGWQFAVITADYRGFANVEGGALAMHQALYSFDGSKPVNERPGYQNGKGYSFKVQNFQGPFQDNYYIHNEIDPRIAPWSACGAGATQPLFVTTYLTARALDWRSPASAQITLDSIDGQVQSQQFSFTWRRCAFNPPPPGGGNQPPPPPGRGVPPPGGGGRPPRF